MSILYRNQIHITRVFTANDGFVVLTYNDSDTEKIFSNDVKVALDNKEFIPILPPEQSVKKSVIASIVDQFVYEWGEE